MELRKKMEARIDDLAAMRAARRPTASAPAALGRSPDTGPSDHSIILNAMEVMKQFMAQQQQLMILSGMGAMLPPLPLGAACAVPQPPSSNEIRPSMPNLGVQQVLTSTFQQLINTDPPVDAAGAPLVNSQSHTGADPDIAGVDGNVNRGWSNSSALPLEVDGADCAPVSDSPARRLHAILPAPQPESRKV
jgi:hypothetical protein